MGEVRSGARIDVALACATTSTLLTLAHAYQQRAQLNERPPLDRFLSERDEILAQEKFPDEDKYYSD